MNQKQKTVFFRSRATAVILCLFSVAAFSTSALEIPRAFSSAPDSLKVHARFLASDELTGRGVETPGIRLARDYIAGEFARYGLRPGGDRGTYLQSFEITFRQKQLFVAIDGEVRKMSSPLRYTIRPQALHVIMPRLKRHGAVAVEVGTCGQPR